MGQQNEEKTVRVDEPVTPDAVAGQPATPCIVHFSGRMTGVTYWLSSNKELIIGRTPESDVCIRDQPVSQRHARVVVSPEGEVIVEDLGSTNGTYVNGQKIMRHVLHDGDKILIPPRNMLKFSYEMNVAPEVAGRNGADAIRDALTGVYTKQYLLMQINEDFVQAKKQNEDLALLMVVIDGFAKINEKHGTDRGDRVLREVTKVISSVLRQEDLFARYGTDTFAIRLRNLSEAGCVVLAQRIRRAAKYHHFIHEGEKIRVTISLGIDSLTSKMKNAMDLIRAVQTRLDKAKGAGRDNINGSQSVRAIFRQIANKHAA